MITLTSKFHGNGFDQLVPIFKNWLDTWNPIDNNIPLAGFLNEGKKGLIRSLHGSKLLKSQSDFKGVYVFIKAGIPFYVGISGHVIERINQHVKGTTHFTSSLCYRLGAELHIATNGQNI